MKYKRKKAPDQRVAVIGMLHIVEVRMVNRATEEKIKQKLLVVGSEAADIEKKLRWIFDVAQFDEFSISGVEKVRKKVHTISTVITKQHDKTSPATSQHGEAKEVPQGKQHIEKYDPNLYAVGIATTMMAKDEEHALRKVGNALISSTMSVESHSGASLSENSTVTIEKVPLSSGYAKPRDVSAEINRAHIVRG